jgi:hypothetical protein
MDMDYNEAATQELHDAIQARLKNDTWLEGSRVRHSLRGIFNLNLEQRAAFIDTTYRPEIVRPVMKEFNRYVTGAGKGDPTPEEIDAFVATIADDAENTRSFVENNLKATYKSLAKHRL